MGSGGEVGVRGLMEENNKLEDDYKKAKAKVQCLYSGRGC